VQHQSAPIRSQFGLLLDELLVRHPEELCNASDFRLAYAHNAVLDAAARPAHPALKMQILSRAHRL
jgi:hypothetical protein